MWNRPSVSRPGETASRSEAPFSGPWARGMFGSPGSSSFGMSRKCAREGTARDNGCWICAALRRPQVWSARRAPSRVSDSTTASAAARSCASQVSCFGSSRCGRRSCPGRRSTSSPSGRPMRTDEREAVGTADYVSALVASFLGWTLDAFDFFVLVFVLPNVAAEFGRGIPDLALTITITLAFRPVGAFLFGLLADRYGRRLPLMIDLVFYSVVEVLSGLAPNYTTFLVLRALFGIGMGGEWGVGASLAMEKVPPRWRGVLSGVLQEGYALGYLLAACCYFFVFPRWGWRAMFYIGGLPALLALFVR